MVLLEGGHQVQYGVHGEQAFVVFDKLLVNGNVNGFIADHESDGIWLGVDARDGATGDIGCFGFNIGAIFDEDGTGF